MFGNGLDFDQLALPSLWLQAVLHSWGEQNRWQPALRSLRARVVIDQGGFAVPVEASFPLGSGSAHERIGAVRLSDGRRLSVADGVAPSPSGAPSARAPQAAFGCTVGFRAGMGHAYPKVRL